MTSSLSHWAMCAGKCLFMLRNVEVKFSVNDLLVPVLYLNLKCGTSVSLLWQTEQLHNSLFLPMVSCSPHYNLFCIVGPLSATK